MVARTEPLPREVLETSPSYFELSSYPAILIENIWAQGSMSIQSLLAPASIVSPNWLQFDHTQTSSISLQWKAPQDFNRFKDVSPYLSSRNGDVYLNDPSWTDETLSDLGDGKYSVQVNSIYDDSEVAQFKIGKITGIGNDMKVEVIDTNNLQGTIETSFTMKYMSKGHFSYWNINWNDAVPTDWIHRTGGTYVIDIGKTPIADNFKRKGWIMGVEFTATHQLNSNRKSTTQVQYGHVIGKD